MASFKTLAEADEDPPIILTGPIAASITDEGARVEFATDEDVEVVLEYQAVGSIDLPLIVQRPTRAREHSIPLTNLDGAQEYTFSLALKDANDNETTRGDLSFRTLSAPDESAPVLVAGPVVSTRLEDQVVIEWNTDEPSDSKVEFGPTGAYGNSVSDMDDVVEHALRLTNLESGEEYHYRVCSTDPNDNPTTCSADFTFTSLAAADIAPPQILTGPIASGITDQSATLRLSSDEVSTSKVVFGIEPDLSDGRELVSAKPTLDHSIALTNLLPGTIYHYQAALIDVSGNASTDKNGTFTTRAAPDLDPPVVLTGPVAVSITDKSASIDFTTDEDAEVLIEYATSEMTTPAVYQRPERLRRHSISLTNLEGGLLHTYAVRLRDAIGNEINVSDQTFKTLATPDVSPPVVISGPVVTTRLEDQVVIEWKTDEPGDTEVRYGTTVDYGGAVSIMDDVLSHSARLTNLEPNTTYHYATCSTDGSGNGPACSEDLTFTTLSTPDTELPVIIGAPVVRNRTDVSADIAWSTNELSDEFVEYGTDPSYGLIAGSADHRLEHEVRLTNLKPGTTYYFRIASTDPAGNGPTRSADGLNFFTRSAPDLLPPVVIAGPLVMARTQDAATIQWTTDEPSDSRVDYGTDADIERQIIMPEDVTSHTIPLTNLEPDTEYFYQIGSMDASGNGPTTGAILSFKTLSAPDIQPPQLISGPVARNVTATSATIEWLSDEPSNSVIDVGDDASYALNHIERGDLVEHHSVAISNLVPGATYHFKVSSSDVSGNTMTTDPSGAFSYSRDYTFKTLLQPDADAPVFLEGPVVFAQDEAAKAEWLTDEPARYELVFDTEPTLSGDQREIMQSNEYSERHSVDLTRLVKGTAYYYQLTAWDLSGNAAVAGTASRNKRAAKLAQPPGGAGSFLTRPDPDSQYPVLIGPPTIAAKTATSLAIEWETDERADSFVEFVVDGEFENLIGSASDVTRHRVVLTNLEPGSNVEYVVNSTDASGNGATKSTPQIGTTALEVDLSPPRILVEPEIVYKTDRTVTIEWTTDEFSDSVVEYGIGETELVRIDANTVTNHRVTLTNLVSGTEYVYRIASTDMSGNGPVSRSDLTFTTDTVPDITVPEIVKGPEVNNVSLDKATITWTTNELADSFVDYGLSADELYEVVGEADDVFEHAITLTNLTAATTYHFAVGSIDRANNGPVLSETYSFTTADSRDLSAPEMPTALSGQLGSGAVRTEWSASAANDLAGYNLYRRTGGAAQFKLVASMLQQNAYIDGGLTNGVPYVYQVTAVDNASPPNESVPAAPISLAPGPDYVPTAPLEIGSTTLDNNTNLTIRNSTPYIERSELTYTFQVSTSEEFGDLVARAGRVEEGEETSTEWTFARALIPGEEYWWRARANDGYFDGSWMEPSSFVVPEILSESDTTIARSPDFDKDGVVGFTDFFLFADQFGRPVEEVNTRFDLDQDGKIGFGDFFILSDNFSGDSQDEEGGIDGEVITPGPGPENPAGADTVKTPTSDWASPDGVRPPHVDRRPRTVRVKPVNTKTLRDALVDAELRVIDFKEGFAELAFRIDCESEIVGYGIVLRHVSGVNVDFMQADSTPSDDAVALRNVFLRKSTRTWLGEHGFECPKDAAGASTVRFQVNFPINALGSEIAVAQLWTVDSEGQVVRVDEAGRTNLVPQVYRLDPPYPNPFNPVVNLRYTLPDRVPVKIAIYNIVGQIVYQKIWETMEPGIHSLQWHGQTATGTAVGSGVYFVRLNAGNFVTTQKIMLLK